MPWFGLHVKYVFPWTVPLFFPFSSSKMTPIHFPKSLCKNKTPLLQWCPVECFNKQYQQNQKPRHRASTFNTNNIKKSLHGEKGLAIICLETSLVSIKCQTFVKNLNSNGLKVYFESHSESDNCMEFHCEWTF